MSSRRKHPAHQNQYPTGWTDWEWSEEHRRNYRARERRKGEWEYEYAPSHESKLHVSEGPTPWTPRGSAVPHDTLPRSDGQRQPYEVTGTQSGYYSVDSLSTGFAQTKIDSGAYDARYQHGYQSHGRSSYQQAGNENDSKDKAVFICPTCSMIFTKTSDLERHHITVHVNEGARPFQCLIEGCSAGVRSWTTLAGLRSHEKTWHGGGGDAEKSESMQPLQPGSQSEPDEPLESLHKLDYPEDTFQSSGYATPMSQWTSSQHTSHIATRNPKPKYDDLDSRFKVHRSSEFKFGRVFKVLWSEPVGSGGTEITLQPAKYGEKAFHKIRRFMIIRTTKNSHSTCIPILTYGNKGVLKPGVHPEDHTVVYSSKAVGPYYLEGEKNLLTKRPIRIDMKDASERLDPLSRLNYAKIYTVEHNVKVLFIGWVGKNYEQEVVTCFNEANPPVALAYTFQNDASPNDSLFSHAQGGYPRDPDAANVATSSELWSSGAPAYPPSPATTNPSYNSSEVPPYSQSYNAAPQIPPSGQYDHGPSYNDGYDAQYA